MIMSRETKIFVMISYAINRKPEIIIYAGRVKNF